MTVWLIAGFLIVVPGAVIILARTEASERRGHLAARSEIAQTPFGALEYVITGEGPPVLVLHGAGGGYDQGLLIAEAVGGEGFRWIAVSRFGYLNSPLPEDASTVAQAHALATLLSQLGIDRAGVLAMSGGAPPALQLAALHPDRVGSMALLSPAPFTPFGGEVEGRPVPTAFYTALAGSDVVYWLMRRVARGTLKSAFDARPELRAGDEDGFARRLVDTFLPASARRTGLGNEIAAVDPGTVYDLESIRARVLVVHAADDGLNPVAIGEAIAARIDGAAFIRYDSGGHLLLGHHGALRAQVSEFFSRAPSDPPPGP